MSVKSTLAGLHAIHALVWLGVFIVTAGLLACGAGVYMALASALSPLTAALIVGGLLVLIGGGLTGLGLRAYFRGARPKPATQQNQSEPGAEQALLPVLGEDATRWVREHRTEATLMALAAGAVVATSPTIRRTLVRALGPIAVRGAARTLNNLSDDP